MSLNTNSFILYLSIIESLFGLNLKYEELFSFEANILEEES